MTVSIVDFGFQPAEVQVSVGQGVTWTNNGNFPHTVNFDDGTDCGRLAGGASTSAVFNEAGAFAYICIIHPQMQGRVTVQP